MNLVLNSVLFSLNSVYNGNPIDNSIHHGYCMKEFPSTCTTVRVRLRGKKQNLEEIIFYGLEWKIWHAKNPYVLFARGLLRVVILSLKKLNLVTRKPVFGFSDQVRLKPVCSATETSYRLEILDIATGCIILSKQRTTKALISMRGCAG